MCPLGCRWLAPGEDRRPLPLLFDERGRNLNSKCFLEAARVLPFESSAFQRPAFAALLGDL